MLSLDHRSVGATKCRLLEMFFMLRMFFFFFHICEFLSLFFFGRIAFHCCFGVDGFFSGVCSTDRDLYTPELCTLCRFDFCSTVKNLSHFWFDELSNNLLLDFSSDIIWWHKTAVHVNDPFFPQVPSADVLWHAGNTNLSDKQTRKKKSEMRKLIQFNSKCISSSKAILYSIII